MIVKTVLVTGANRGIGLEFINQLHHRNYEVIASCRDPEKATKLKQLLPEENIMQLDVNRQESINRAYTTMSKRTDNLHGIINNAGIGGNSGGLRNATSEDCLNTIAVNALGPLFVTKSWLPLLRKGSIIMNITSLMGSIEDNTSGGYYSYRISKAALNMVTKNLHIELSKKGIVVVCIHPGWVRTDMGGLIAPLSRKKSVSGMMKVFEQLSPSDSGCFFSYKGEKLPW